MLTRATRGDAGGQSHAGDAGDSSHLEDGCVCVYARLGARGTGKTDRKQTSPPKRIRARRGIERSDSSARFRVAAPFSQDKQSQILEFSETTTGCAIFRETALLAFLRARKGADVKSSSMMFRGTKKKKTKQNDTRYASSTSSAHTSA
jgi:hypothetical protein